MSLGSYALVNDLPDEQIIRAIAAMGRRGMRWGTEDFEVLGAMLGLFHGKFKDLTAEDEQLQLTIADCLENRLLGMTDSGLLVESSKESLRVSRKGLKILKEPSLARLRTHLVDPERVVQAALKLGLKVAK